jgi:hypothetical protein
MPRTLIPHQLSEAVFRFYEPYIREGVDRFPGEVAWDISLLPVSDRRAPTTFVGRFRDAITSLRKFSWQTDINVAKLLQISGHYCIWWEPGTYKVWFKNRSHSGKPVHHNLAAIIPVDERAAAMQASVVPWRDATEEEMKALCTLLNSGKLTGPYELQKPLDDESMKALRMQFDNVSVQVDIDRKVTIFT